MWESVKRSLKVIIRDKLFTEEYYQHFSVKWSQ